MVEPSGTAPFVQELLAVRREGLTGVMEVQGEDVCTLVYFREGIPVFAEEGTLGETLGRVLMRQGRLSADQYHQVLERVTVALMDSEEVRFGDVAVRLGYLTREQVDAALAEQVALKILHCIQWDATSCGFRTDPDALARVPHFPVAAEAVAWSGIRRYCSPERCRLAWGSQEHRYPELLAPTDEVRARFELSASAVGLLKLLDGTRKTGVIVLASPLDVVEASQLLALLTWGALVAYHEHPLESRSRAAEGPGEKPRVTPEPFRASLAPGGARASRSDEPERLARIEAERLFNEGRDHLLSGRHQEAHQLLRRAALLYPKAREYLLYAEWADFKTLTGVGDLLLKRKKLRSLAVHALRQDRNLAFGHCVLGYLSMLDGNVQDATRAFRLAVRLDPSDPTAAKWQAELGLDRRGPRPDQG